MQKELRNRCVKCKLNLHNLCFETIFCNMLWILANAWLRNIRFENGSQHFCPCTLKLILSLVWFFLVKSYLLHLIFKLIWKRNIFNLRLGANSEAYWELCRTSRMQILTKQRNGGKSLTISAKSLSQIFDSVLNPPLEPLIIFTKACI